MIRFRLRILLIATALIGLFFGLQGHVHVKARRFVEEMRPPASLKTLEYEREKHALIVKVSPIDVLLFRRRCRVLSGFLNRPDGTSSFRYVPYHVNLLGEPRLVERQ